MTVKDLIRKRNEYVMACGGWFGLREADDAYNDLNRNIIQAFKDENEHCYMGNINLYGQKREDIISGKNSCYDEYVGQKVYNFGCDFIVPEADEKLAQLIKEWNTDGKASLIDAIQNRIDEINGIRFIWR